MSTTDALRHTTAALTPMYGEDEARSMAKIVLEDAFGVARNQAVSDLHPSDVLRLEADILPRLLSGEPIQYVLGKALFFGQYFRVNPAVLIPRQETEELVALALKTLKTQSPTAVLNVLDMGTGSGCIPIVLAKKRANLKAFGVDISTEALALAQQNAADNGVEVIFQQMDILDRKAWQQLTVEHFDMILSNPPYIPPSEKPHIPAHVLDWEPSLALFSPEEDPCIFYRVIADFAKERLRPGGTLLFEVNEFRAQAVLDILMSRGFSGVTLHQDIAGADRMVSAVS